MNTIPKKPIPFALACSRPVRRWVIGAVCTVLVATLLVRVMVYSIKIVTDVVVEFGAGRTPLSQVWFWALFLPAVYQVTELIWRSSGFCGMRWITGSGAEATRLLFSHLTGHSASYFSDRYAGSLTNKISNASKGIENLTAAALWQFFPLVVGLTADTYLVYLSHPYFAGILAGWCSIYLALNILFVRKLHQLAYASAESSSKLKGKIVDSTSNIETVQHSGELDYEKQYIGQHIGAARTAHLREWWFSEWILVTNGVLLTAFMVLMLGTGAWLVGQHAISVGSLVLIITVVLSLEQRFWFLGQQLTQAVGFYGQVGEGLNEILEPHAIPVVPEAPALIVRKGEVVFDRVSFAYRDNSVFSDLSLTIKGGEKVGLVGPSGAGKSTLMNLLLRHFDLREGEIRIDGSPIREAEIQSLRRAIAVVPQTTSLFHRTIKENIRYGRLEASDEEIFEAARLAQADEFIRGMGQGYETFVGERGVKLSGGQRQRVAVARALLKGAPILILDEATSSLDSESEAAIQEALRTLMQGKTVIAVAHRLSTLRAMDRILVLDHGRIVEDGTHSELLALGGLYSRLWSSQVSGFIQEPGAMETEAAGVSA